jgi:hypothetical protein
VIPFGGVSRVSKIVWYWVLLYADTLSAKARSQFTGTFPAYWQPRVTGSMSPGEANKRGWTRPFQNAPGKGSAVLSGKCYDADADLAFRFASKFLR